MTHPQKHTCRHPHKGGAGGKGGGVWVCGGGRDGAVPLSERVCQSRRAPTCNWSEKQEGTTLAASATHQPQLKATPSSTWGSKFWVLVQRDSTNPETGENGWEARPPAWQQQIRRTQEFPKEHQKHPGYHFHEVWRKDHAHTVPKSARTGIKSEKPFREMR